MLECLQLQSARRAGADVDASPQIRAAEYKKIQQVALVAGTPYQFREPAAVQQRQQGHGWPFQVFWSGARLRGLSSDEEADGLMEIVAKATSPEEATVRLRKHAQP